MPRDESRDICRMPTEAQEAPVSVQWERAGPSWCTVWRRDGLSQMFSWTVSRPSFPQLSFADVTIFPGLSSFCCTKIADAEHQSRKLHVTQKVLFCSCLLSAQSLPFLLPFCLCLYLHPNSNIFLCSRPRHRLNWFRTLVSRLTRDFASSYKSLNSASSGPEFILTQISVCRAVYGVNLDCEYRGFGCLLIYDF